jgi:uncharacterized membrane protein YkoI
MGVVTYRTFAQDPACVETEENGTGCDTEEANEQGENEAADGDNASVPADAAITADEAKAIAEKANPGTAAREVEFEREGGVDAWEVELDNGVEVRIDPNTGDILNAGQ